MKQNRANIAPWALFAALCIGAFFSPWILPWAEAQRTGYVERVLVSTGTVTGHSALANQLAPNPVASKVLASLGTSNRVAWVDAPNSYSTSIPVAVGTSGAVGTAVSLSRSDHRHQGDGDEKVAAYSGATVGYLQDTVFSYTGSISVGVNLTEQKLNLNTTFGTSTPASVATSGSVGTSASSSRSDHVHAAGAGSLVQQYAYNYSAEWQPTAEATWQAVDPHTISALGSRFIVTVHVTFLALEQSPAYSHLCAIGIMGNTGSTASTLRGPQTWAQAVNTTAGPTYFQNTTIWPNKALIGSFSVRSEFTLSTGDVTIAAATYRYERAASQSCTIPAYGMTVYVDVFN